MNRTIEFNDYYHPGDDTAFSMRSLLNDCGGRNDITICFERGTYHFYPDRASEASCSISNHGVCGYKRIAMHLKNFRGLTLDGRNSIFVFHGVIIPFVMDSSTELTLKNLSIIWEDPMMIQTTVISSGSGIIEIRPDEEKGFEIFGKRIYLKGYHYREPLYDWSVIEMDATAGGPAYLSGDDSLRISINELDAMMTENQTIRLTGNIRRYPKIGNKLLLRGGRRYAPAVFIKNSEKIRIENVNIFNAIGMGVIAQKSSDISLLKIKVIPDPESGRVFSANGDAAHFVNCKGMIAVRDCVFTQQMDDALNIHGIYMKIAEKLKGGQLLARLVHEEQQGVDVFTPGDRVQWVRKGSMMPYGENTIKSVEYINIEHVILTLEDELPEDLELEDCIENLTWNADLLITNCIIMNNRARGLLISSKGKIEIANNYISSPGAGILISGDCNHWFESGAVKDVTIRNNIFENCTTVPQWGNFTIIIKPEVSGSDKPPECFHRNITITNNIFKTFTQGIVKAYCVDGLTLENNSISRTFSYPDHNETAQPYEFAHCRNVVFEDTVEESGNP